VSLGLGVDCGGSLLRLCLVRNGKILRRETLDSPSPSNLAAALKIKIASWKLPRLDRLTVGSTGLWQESRRRKIKKSLKNLAKTVTIMSDVELAHYAAFKGAGGVLVIAGTGSIALAQDEKGQIRRAGGLGPLLGDEGSGFWIGRQALLDPKLSKYFPKDFALRSTHAKDNVKQTAALARKTLALAKKGNLSARKIRRAAACELAGVAKAAARGLRFAGKQQLSWHGSLFRDSGLLGDFKKTLAGKFRFVAPKLKPELAAAMYGGKVLHLLRISKSGKKIAIRNKGKA
jgi:N-acetylglucosamine kinase-like BadF-type ATPase